MECQQIKVIVQVGIKKFKEISLTNPSSIIKTLYTIQPIQINQNGGRFLFLKVLIKQLSILTY